MNRVWRKLLAMCLLLGIFANCANYWIVSSAYALNKSYISGVLCSNKDKPHLHCEGKCFLAIKLKEFEQKNKHEQEQLKRSIESIPNVHKNLLPAIFKMLRVFTYRPHLQSTPITRDREIFQPPKCS